MRRMTHLEVVARSCAMACAFAIGCAGSLDPWTPSDADVGQADAGGDADADGSTSPCQDVTCPPGQSCVGGACVPWDPCDGVTCPNPGDVCSAGVCVSGEADGDGDGSRARDDCDDTNPAVHPGATETCNGVDDDCDLSRDEGFDLDGDGFTSCGADGLGADCDDARAGVFPGAEEVCNGTDDDCDGTVDVLASRPCVAACGDGVERCEGGAWICDAPATGECTPGGAPGTASCGNCGTMSRTCTAACTWGDYGACTGEGECAIGEERADGCPNACMASICGPTCLWSSSCEACSSACGSFSQCGTTCPAGYYADRLECTSDCTAGSCTSAPDNAADCEPICGAAFTQCGLVCPAGYHAERYECSSGCTSGSCTSAPDNSADCALTTGDAFSQCGLVCPAGYHAERYECSSGCTSGSCTSAPDNAADCALTAGDAFSQCGLVCPAGYHAERYECSSGCTSGSCTSAPDNAADCALTTGASFTQCGTSCPAGYVIGRAFCTSGCTSGSCTGAPDNAVDCDPI
jgi:hypothetical protein